MTRPDPEVLLRRVQAEEEFERRGRLKIFLGYSSGVGKSFKMLDEGRRRRKRGEDVVVGAIQPHRSPAIEALLAQLEVIPLKIVRGVPMIDKDAILRRHPQFCLIDGLAYDNPPGSAHAKRWQDMEDLLAAGISVIGTVNLQYIEELRDEVERITGKEVSDTVPLSFIKTADEIEVVDTPTNKAYDRAGADGAAHEPPDAAAQRLAELREIALLLAADVVDHQRERYLDRHGFQQISGVQERILVCVTPRNKADRMIESGHRNAKRFQCELHVIYVNDAELTPDEQKALDHNFSLARKLNAHVQMLESEDPIHAIIGFARERGVTQIFIGHSTHESFWHRVWGSFVDRLIRQAEGMDVRVFPN